MAMNKAKTVRDLIDCEEQCLAPIGLKEQIVMRIKYLERRSLMIRLLLLAILSTSSLVAVILSFYSLGRALAKSGFFEYFSLVTDTSVITTYWKEVAFSLVESLPFLSIALMLAVIDIFIWSGSKTWSRAREIMRAA